MRAIQIDRYGGPDVLELRELPHPRLHPGEALVKLGVAGVNYIDIYYREGRYPAPLPLVLGSEGAGVVEEVAPDVTTVRPGDRVAYCLELGSYAELAAVPAWRLVPVPEGIDDRVAAAAMVQGLTTQYLVRSTVPLQRGQTVLIHAAAGGLGLMLVQVAHEIGCRVIGTTSTEEKAELAKQAGADDVILYTQVDFAHETRRLTGGEGVDVVYDSVGRTTFEKGLDILKVRGLMVLVGASSGPVPPMDPMLLARKGSLYLTRPNLAQYARSRDEILMRAAEVFDWIQRGVLDVHIGHTYELEQARQAHEGLEARRTMGKIVLVP